MIIDFYNYVGPIPPRPKFSGEEFETRMVEKHLLTRNEVFPGDVFIMESYSFLFVDGGVFIWFILIFFKFLELQLSMLTGFIEVVITLLNRP